MIADKMTPTCLVLYSDSEWDHRRLIKYQLFLYIDIILLFNLFIYYFYYFLIFYFTTLDMSMHVTTIQQSVYTYSNKLSHFSYNPHVQGCSGTNIVAEKEVIGGEVLSVYYRYTYLN